MQISGVSAGYSQYGMSQNMRKPPSMEEKFSEIDSDGDSSVSFEEFSADIESMQDKMASGEMPLHLLVVAEAVVPSSMSSEEMEEMFSEADTDGDGVLSSDEFSSHMESLRPDPGVMQQMSGGGMSTESFDADQVLLDMMDSEDDESEQSSISNYTNQLLQAYGLNTSSQSSTAAAVSSVSSSLNVSA